MSQREETKSNQESVAKIEGSLRALGWRGFAQMARESWALIRPFWVSSAWKKAWLLLVCVLALEFFAVWLMVKITDLNKTIFDALQEKKAGLFYEGLRDFLIVALIYVFSAIWKVYLRQGLQMDWRAWMTKERLGAWLASGAFAKIEASGISDNPDQRVSDDIDSFCASTLSIFLGFLSSAATLGSFSVLLWDKGGPLEFEALGTSGSIPGYMFWTALFYSILGTWGAHLLGRRLIDLNISRQRLEADFRYGLMRARERFAGLFLAKGAGAEALRSEGKFAKVRENWLDFMKVTKRFSAFTIGYSQLSVLFPLVVCAPRYFKGAMTMGDMMQISSAFGQVQGSFSFFIDSYAQISSWRACSLRLSAFDKACAENKPRPVWKEEAGAWAARGQIPLGEGVILDCSFELKAGRWAQVSAPSGFGKSSWAQALFGLRGEGVEVRGPAQESALCLAQEPFFPEGSIRQALLWPSAPGAFSEEEMKRALAAVGLGKRARDLDEDLGRGAKWSGGEAQRLNLARSILLAPKALFLDEATGALDLASEALALRALKDALPGASLVMVSHRHNPLIADLWDERWEGRQKEGMRSFGAKEILA